MPSTALLIALLPALLAEVVDTIAVNTAGVVALAEIATVARTAAASPRAAIVASVAWLNAVAGSASRSFSKVLLLTAIALTKSDSSEF